MYKIEKETPDFEAYNLVMQPIGKFIDYQLIFLTSSDLILLSFLLYEGTLDIEKLSY